MTDSIRPPTAPDPRLGRLLREHLDPGDDEAFVARMQAAFARARATTPGARAPAPVWDTLAEWAVPALAAAAAVAIFLAGFLIGESRPAGGELAAVAPAVTLDDALRPTGMPPEFLNDAVAPDPSVILTASWEVTP